MTDTRKSFLLLSDEYRELALELPNATFKKMFREPHDCSWTGAIDKQFGCPFLFRGENHCPYCTLRIKNK